MTNWKAGMRAEIPSGLGGIFEIKLIEKLDNGRWNAKIDMPSAGDFHNTNVQPLESELREVRHG